MGVNDWPGLASRHLGWVGLTDTAPGYDMQRPNPPTAHVVVAYGGRGEVWIDGQWTHCESGEAYFTPPHQPMGFRAIKGERWHIAWAYLIGKPSEFSPTITLSSLDARPIVNAIEGLHMEAARHVRTDRLELWGDLASSYAREIATGEEEADSLWPLWSQVDSRLGETWTLPRLADLAGMSLEKLRLQTIRATGRSPMRQVAHLRMRRAEMLLGCTKSKLFSIAQQVGYENVFAFSTAFRRWKGLSPKQCRANLMKVTTLPGTTA